jgi:SAM-dependent methyltransferase
LLIYEGSTYNTNASQSTYKIILEKSALADPNSNLGYLLHPIIAGEVTDRTRVADIGTGTGRWLLDLGKQLPASCTLHGFDITDIQFISPEMLPESVALKTADAIKGFAPEYHGKYDIVHARFLMAAMRDESDWENFARNILSLLKPGGRIQWVEVFDTDNFVLGGEPAARELFQESFVKYKEATKERQTAMSYPHRVPLLLACGAKGVHEEKIPTDRVVEQKLTWTITFSNAIHLLIERKIHDGTALGWSEEEAKERARRIEELARNKNLFIRHVLQSVLATKG